MNKYHINGMEVDEYIERVEHINFRDGYILGLLSGIFLSIIVFVIHEVVK